MQPIYTYRDAVASDMPQLLQLRTAAYQEFLPALPPQDRDTFSKALANEARLQELQASSKGLVCEAGAHIAGMAFLVPHGNPTDIYPADWCYIRLVGVHPAYRGLGIAKALTQQCIALARDSGEHTIGLHTSEKMHAARHIYESLGFRIRREIPPIFGMRYWLYALDISGQ